MLPLPDNSARAIRFAPWRASQCRMAFKCAVAYLVLYFIYFPAAQRSPPSRIAGYGGLGWASPDDDDPGRLLSPVAEDEPGPVDWVG